MIVKLELVTIKNDILEVPNLKLVFLTFERSEIWQNLEKKKKRVPALQGIKPGLPDSQVAMYTTIPQSLAVKSKGEIRTNCNFFQISKLTSYIHMYLELVTIKNEIFKVPNLKLVFLTFERSEIWQKLESALISP